MTPRQTLAALSAAMILSAAASVADEHRVVSEPPSGRCEARFANI